MSAAIEQPLSDYTFLVLEERTARGRRPPPLVDLLQDGFERYQEKFGRAPTLALLRQVAAQPTPGQVGAEPISWRAYGGVGPGQLWLGAVLPVAIPMTGDRPRRSPAATRARPRQSPVEAPPVEPAEATAVEPATTSAGPMTLDEVPHRQASGQPRTKRAAPSPVVTPSPARGRSRRPARPASVEPTSGRSAANRAPTSPVRQPSAPAVPSIPAVSTVSTVPDETAARRRRPSHSPRSMASTGTGEQLALL